MNRSVNVCAAAALWVSLLGGAQAQSNADPLSLKIANAISPDRFFVRAGVIGVKVKTKSGDAYDVTGPLISKSDLETLQNSSNNLLRDALIANGVSSTQATNVQTTLRVPTQGIQLLINQMNAAGRQVVSLGTPLGIKSIASENINTAGLSLGMYLDDEYKWTVEAYVLAAPPTTSILGSAPSNGRLDSDGLYAVMPLPIQGQKLVTSKLLPPTVVFGRYWGGKDSRFRPYTGVMGMYGIFYDTKATDLLNNFVGGSNPGDTTVSIKNTFGLGPVLGLKYQANDSWHISLNIGNVKLKTVGTIVTEHTQIKNTTGGILAYGRDPNDSTTIPGSITETIQTAETNTNIRVSQALREKFGGITGLTSTAVTYLHWVQGGSVGALPEDMGTFVRKTDSTLTNTIFMLSVGRSF